MWIKTTAGVLLNCDQVECFRYDGVENITKAFTSDYSWFDVAEGDIVPLITSAIIKNQNYLGVR